MKSLRSSILLAVLLAFGARSRRGRKSIPVDQDNAHKAKALLDQMIQALGGHAYLTIQDITQEGRTYSFYHGRRNSLGIVFWRFYKFPDKDRIELTKKRDVIEVFNGDDGYEITYKGTHAADPKDLTDYSAAPPVLARLGAAKVAERARRRAVLRRAFGRRQTSRPSR